MLATLIATTLFPLTNVAIERPRFYIVAVGVKEYDQKKTGFVELAGPKDAKLFVEGMKQWFGVSRAKGDIIELLDSPTQNSRKSIWGALDRMASQAKPTDAIVFYYSGHGAQVFDPSKATKMSQAIVPIDIRREKNDPRGVIVRDSVITGPDFNTILKRLADKKAVNVTLFFDSCHSESISRGILRTKSGFPDAALTGVKSKGNVKLDRENETGWDLSNALAIISATRADWSAYEVGEKGLLTSSLISAMNQLREKGGPVSYGSVFNLVRAEVKRRAAQENVLQEPQFEGNGDRQVFDTTVVEQQPAFRVFVRGNALKLEAGEIQALKKGFLMGLYPPQTTKFDGKPAYLALVDNPVETSESSLTLVGEDGKPLSGADPQKLGGYHAVLLDGLPSGRVKLRIDAPNVSPAVRDGLAKIPVIEIVEGAAAYDLLLSAPGQVSGLVTAPAGNWSVTDAGGIELASHPGQADMELVSQVKTAAWNLAKRKTLLELGPAGKSQVAIEAELVPVVTIKTPEREVTVELGKTGQKSLAIATQKEPETDGKFRQRFAVRVRTVQKDEAAAFAPYITILDLMPDRKINRLWPDPKSNAQSAQLRKDGNWYYVGNETSFVDGSDLSAINGFRVDSEADGKGREVFKIMATERPENFSAMFTTGARSGKAKSELTALERMLGSLWDGTPETVLARAGSGTAGGSANWAVAELHLFVDEKP